MSTTADNARVTDADRSPFLACSAAAHRRDEPMFGTASLGYSWLLLELCGGWGYSAFLDSPTIIDRALGRSIVQRAEAAGMRIAAIRKPGRRDTPARWRWFIARTDTHHSTLVSGESLCAADYLDIPLDGSTGTPTTIPLVAVCAHGRHDRCCAVRGRKAIKSIADQYPEWCWESSHLGGDRFAATMTILPDGLSYGRIDTAEDAATIVDAYTAGYVVPEYLRGRTCITHPAQAAQHFARIELGDYRIDSLHPGLITETDGGYLVELRRDDAVVHVEVGTHFSEPILTTCRATIPGAVRQFSLRSLRVD